MGISSQRPVAHLPQPSSRELRRIRLYDTVSIDSVFFVVSEMQEVTYQANHFYIRIIPTAKPFSSERLISEAQRMVCPIMETNEDGFS